MQKCKGCVCVDCVKLGCGRYPVHYTYQRCLHCQLNDLSAVADCVQFELRRLDQPVRDQVRLPRVRKTQLDKILDKLERLEKLIEDI